MTWDYKTRTIALFGGNGSGGLANDTWEIDGGPWRLCDPAQGRCTTRPAVRCCVGLAYDSVRKKLVLFGGGFTPFPNAYGDTWVWDGTNWSCAVAPCS